MEKGRIFSLASMFVLGLLVGHFLLNTDSRELETNLEPGQQKIRVEKTISEMEIDQFGYTVPWAVSYDGKSYMVNPNYTIHTEIGGTVTMLVRHSKDGYHAYPKEKIERRGIHWMNGVSIKVHY
jgi:hypothetical protein